MRSRASGTLEDGSMFRSTFQVSQTHCLSVSSSVAIPVIDLLDEDGRSHGVVNATGYGVCLRPDVHIANTLKLGREMLGCARMGTDSVVMRWRRWSR